MIIAGDLGGTKTILALFQSDKTGLSCIKKHVFVSADYDCFEKLLAEFLELVNQAVVKGVCFGVAGPVENGDCVTTNLPWVLKTQEIAEQTKTKNVFLLNDLEATAWGVLDLPDSDFIELNSQAKVSQGNLAILAAGTGLGEALVVWSDNKYHVVATEGGHTDFAPRNELEIGLLQYLMTLHSDHVSIERVVCGQGLVNIYQYLKSIAYAPANQAIESRLNTEDSAAVIAEQAMLENQLCAKALEMFCEIYGAEAGNLALKCLPKGGVILAGGIAAKNLAYIQLGGLLQAYLAKGRYKQILQNFSLKVCLNSEAALIGAAGFLIRNGG